MGSFPRQRAVILESSPDLVETDKTGWRVFRKRNNIEHHSNGVIEAHHGQPAMCQQKERIKGVRKLVEIASTDKKGLEVDIPCNNGKL